MTIIAAIADAHIGNHGPFAKGSVAGINSRCKHGLDVLDRVNRYLEDINNRLGLPPIVVSLGDLFDVSTPTPPVIAAVARKLYNADWRVLLGNHEMASAVAGDNALAPLFSTSDVYDVPTVDRDSGIEDASVIFVPYRPGPAREWLPGAIEEALESERTTSRRYGRKPRLLCLHLGISDEDTPPWLRDANDQIEAARLLELMDKFDIDAAVAGNWHTQQVFGGGRILQVGTICPKSFSDSSAFAVVDGYGAMALWDSADPRRFRLVSISGPRFVRTHNLRSAIEDVREENEANPDNVLFVRLEIDEADMTEAKMVRDALLATGMVEGCDITLADRRSRDVSAQTVRELHKKAAMESSTIEVALERFVSSMSLEAGVEPARVVEIVKGYINGR